MVAAVLKQKLLGPNGLIFLPSVNKHVKKKGVVEVLCQGVQLGAWSTVLRYGTVNKEMFP